MTRRRWILLIAIVAGILVPIAIVAAARIPFSSETLRKRLIVALEERLEADVELAYPALTRRRVDALRDAIDYEAVYRFVRARLGKLRRRLLETAAEDLALGVLAAFPASRVVVRLRKLHVPVADFDVIPEVEVERVRA